MAVLSLAAIMNTACDNREEEIGEKPEYGSDAIAFSLKGFSTRSEVSTVETSDEVNIIPLGTDEQNNSFFLEESVIDLEAPITRGTPAYTENVRDLYGNSIKTYAPEIQTNTFDLTYDDSKKFYYKTFGRDVWPQSKELQFYMQMPASPTNVDGINYDGGKITFTYNSPETAKDQQDILFTYRKISKADYDVKGYAEVLFHHALTGVKFATGNVSDGLVIKEVKFTGLIDNGTCTVTPIGEGENNSVYVDKPTDYSSANAVKWSNTSVTPNKVISSGEYSTTLVNYGADENGKYKFDSKGEYPASFAAKGNKNNLNDVDATQTFWLIPQKLDNNVKLVITYTINGQKETEDGTFTIDFGKALKNVEWEAGQLRTYTLTIDNVNVKISDEVTVPETATEANGYTGSTKTGVVIKNTGNTDAYIRAAIIGQWMYSYTYTDSEGVEHTVSCPIFGYTDLTQNKVATVASWYDDQFGADGAREQGTFVGLAGYTAGSTSYENPYNGWYLNTTDGYYYYMSAVKPDAEVPELFTSYTVGTAPNTQLAGMEVNIYFTMEIATQAISAYKLTGGTKYASYAEAWADAASAQ